MKTICKLFLILFILTELFTSCSQDTSFENYRNQLDTQVNENPTDPPPSDNEDGDLDPNNGVLLNVQVNEKSSDPPSDDQDEDLDPNN